MSAPLPLGRVAPGSITPRDWLVSIAVHAGALIAAIPLAASLGDVPVQPTALQVPIRWVEAPAVPAAVEPEAAAPVPPSDHETRRAAPRAESPAPSQPAAPPSKPVTKPTPVPTPTAQEKPEPTPPSTRTPTPNSEPTRAPKPKPVSKPMPKPTPDSSSTKTSIPEPVSPVVHAGEAPRPDPRMAEPGEAFTAAVSEPTPAATPSVPEPARPTAAEPPTGDTHAVLSAASGTDAAPAAAAAALSRQRAPDAWRADLEALLAANKRYPRQARRMRQQGVVTVHARFAADGELLRCEVVASSGFRVLDEAALKLVRNAAEQLRSSRAPGRLAEVRVPIAYELNGRGT